jgi:ferritin-like metal-binding protein YciE
MTNSDIHDIEREQDKLQGEIARLKHSDIKLEADLKKKIQDHERDISKLKREFTIEIEKERGELQKIKDQIAEKSHEVAELNTDLAKAHRDAVSELTKNKTSH